MPKTKPSLQPSQTTANSAAPSLRLWLAGYHTPSLNVTAGQHWSKGRRLRKEGAGAVLEGLREVEMADGRWKMGEAKRVLAEARRVLARLIMGHAVEKLKRGALPAVPARLRFERVTCALLDEENFKGSTKGLTDCLRYAFPSMLRDDAKGYVEIEWVQTRCGTKCEQGTWVCLAGGEGAAERPLAVAEGACGPLAVVGDGLGKPEAEPGTVLESDGLKL